MNLNEGKQGIIGENLWEDRKYVSIEIVVEDAEKRGMRSIIVDW